jgi:ABC-type multidrug transport system fused ATPase/permease subunit
VEQEPYIFSGTVRENILFGKKLNLKFYKNVVVACNLLADLREMNNFDLT